MNRSTKGSEQIRTGKKIEQGRRSNRRIDPWGDNFPGLPVMAGGGWLSMWSHSLCLSIFLVPNGPVVLLYFLGLGIDLRR